MPGETVYERLDFLLPLQSINAVDIKKSFMTIQLTFYSTITP